MVSLVFFFHHFFDGSCFQKVSGLFLENAIKYCSNISEQVTIVFR